MDVCIKNVDEESWNKFKVESVKNKIPMGKFFSKVVKEYRAKPKSKLSDLAGKWEMSDKEAEEFMKTLKKGWRKWTESA